MVQIRDYLELVRFSHTLFALPFALLGAALAAHGTDGWHGRARDWIGILLCMALRASAAMAFNRLVDRHYDALNRRTASRHIPTGRLSVPAVAWFTVLCSGGFVAATLLFLPNRWPLYLAGPVLLWLLGYSYSKRFTSLSHFWLGISLCLAPIAAWIALKGTIAWPPILLALAVLLWVAGFDIIYACQDLDFDRNHGLRSVPEVLGIPGALRVAALCHVAHARAASCPGCGVPARADLFHGRRRGGDPLDLRTCSRPTGRSFSPERGLFPGQHRDQPRVACCGCGRSFGLRVCGRAHLVPVRAVAWFNPVIPT